MAYDQSAQARAQRRNTTANRLGHALKRNEVSSGRLFFRWHYGDIGNENLTNPQLKIFETVNTESVRRLLGRTRTSLPNELYLSTDPQSLWVDRNNPNTPPHRRPGLPPPTVVTSAPTTTASIGGSTSSKAGYSGGYAAPITTTAASKAPITTTAASTAPTHITSSDAGKGKGKGKAPKSSSAADKGKGPKSGLAPGKGKAPKSGTVASKAKAPESGTTIEVVDDRLSYGDLGSLPYDGTDIQLTDRDLVDIAVWERNKLIEKRNELIRDFESRLIRATNEPPVDEHGVVSVRWHFTDIADGNLSLRMVEVRNTKAVRIELIRTSMRYRNELYCSINSDDLYVSMDNPSVPPRQGRIEPILPSSTSTAPPMTVSSATHHGSTTHHGPIHDAPSSGKSPPKKKSKVDENLEYLSKHLTSDSPLAGTLATSSVPGTAGTGAIARTGGMGGTGGTSATHSSTAPTPAMPIPNELQELKDYLAQLNAEMS